MNLKSKRKAMQALLNIDDYYVEEIIVKANPNYKNNSIKSDMSLSFGLKRYGKKPRFMLTMKIEVNKSKASFSKSPYYILLKIVGFFSFPKGTDEETMKKMMGLNALAMQYGLARGEVTQSTSNGMHGKFILPSVNFVELLKSRAKSKTRKKTSVKKQQTAQ